MKRALIVVFIITFFNQLSIAQGLLAKKISLNHENTPLVNILKEITELSKVEFSYSKSKIPLDEKINIKADNLSLGEVLKNIFQNSPVSYQVANDRVILTFSDHRQTVRGVVLDRDTQNPIFSATVVVLGTDPLKGAITDMNGNFRIENVPVGRKNIKITFVGYEDRIISNMLIGTGKEVVLDVEMGESFVKMKEIEIKGTNISNEPINEMAMVSGRSFSVEETKRYAASFGDPARLSAAFAGVSGGGDDNNDISIRGNAPRGLLWRLEGVEIPSPNHFSSEGASSGGISMFSTNVISRSDFYTGAFAPEYGNAYSGVFDIRLRNGNNEKREYTMQAGFLGLDFAAEGPFKKGGKSSFLVNYRYSTLGVLYDLGIISQDQNEKNTFQDLSFKMNFPTKKFGTFSVFGMGGLSSFRSALGDFIDDKEDYNMGVVGIKNQLVLNKSTFIKTVLSVTGTRVNDDVTENYDSDTLFFNSQSDFYKTYTRASVTLNKKLNSQHLIELGGTYSYLTYDFTDKEDNSFNEDGYEHLNWFNDKDNSSTLQGFASWKYRIAKNLTFIGGMHVFHFNLNNETSIEPRGSLKWQISPKQSLSAGFGVHSRIESLEYYLGRFQNGDGTTSQHNKNLGLSKANHYVLGYDIKLSDKLYFKTEVYYQDLYNVPVLANQPEAEISRAFSTLVVRDGYTTLPLVNNGTGENYGIEFSLERAFEDNFYFMTNLSLYEAKYTDMDGVERDSRFNGNFVWNFLGGKEVEVGKNLKNIFGFNIKGTLTGNQRYTPIDRQLSINNNRESYRLEDAYSERLENYFRIDIQLNFRKNNPKTTSVWRLDIQNLLNRKNLIGYFYDRGTFQIRREEQIGMIPILSYRLEF